LHWDDGCDLGIKTGPVGAELFEQFAQAFGGPSDAKRARGNAAGVVEDGEPRLFSCSNLRLVSGTVWWAIATSEAP
jgi:hypothetical protein